MFLLGLYHRVGERASGHAYTTTNWERNEWEAGVLLDKAGTEGSIHVTLTWERKDEEDD